MAVPTLSIIIPTFNSAGSIGLCLESIYSQDQRGFEVIIVDNGSTDETVRLIKKDYPEVTLIENPRNCGACRARNQAIAATKGEWILALDSDAILKEDFFSSLETVLKNVSPHTGIIQPKILKQDRFTIYSCGLYLSSLRRFFDIGRDEEDSKVFSRSGDIFGACSACALYRRSMLDQIKDDKGYFDERFFFLVEDVDVAWRAQRKGYTAAYRPELVAFHLGNSSGLNEKARQYLCFRNRYYSIAKNEGFIRYLSRFYPVLFYDLPRFGYLMCTNRYMFKGFRGAETR